MKEGAAVFSARKSRPNTPTPGHMGDKGPIRDHRPADDNLRTRNKAGPTRECLVSRRSASLLPRAALKCLPTAQLRTTRCRQSPTPPRGSRNALQTGPPLPAGPEEEAEARSPADYRAFIDQTPGLRMRT